MSGGKAKGNVGRRPKKEKEAKVAGPIYEYFKEVSLQGEVQGQKPKKNNIGRRKKIGKQAPNRGNPLGFSSRGPRGKRKDWAPREIPREKAPDQRRELMNSKTLHNTKTGLKENGVLKVSEKLE